MSPRLWVSRESLVTTRLNPGPSFLRNLGLPDGFADRTTIHRFGALTVRIASRADLICLKPWAATDASRGRRRAVDLADLREIKPTQQELRDAARWCSLRDGRPDFFAAELAPILTTLGFDPSELADA